MRRSKRRDEAYTLVESLVAMALFMTVVLALLESMNYLVAMSGRNDLAEASLIAQTEIASVSADSLYPKKATLGKFLVERSVSQLKKCVAVTICISPAGDEGRKLVTITKLLPVSNEN